MSDKTPRLAYLPNRIDACAWAVSPTVAAFWQSRATLRDCPQLVDLRELALAVRRRFYEADAIADHHG